MRFGILVAAVALFTIPQDLGLSSPNVGHDLFRTGAKRHVESREDKSFAEDDGATLSYAEEQAALRAYPADEVSPEATLNAQAGFQSFKKNKSVGQWSAIGPLNQARYPALLDVFQEGGDGVIQRPAQFVHAAAHVQPDLPDHLSAFGMLKSRRRWTRPTPHVRACAGSNGL